MFMVICSVENLYKYYPVASGIGSLLSRKGKVIKALDGVSIEIEKAEILGLAGESGSGKTTLGEILVGLQTPTKGRILFEGADVGQLHGKMLKNFRRKVQMIFQDPYATLNPRFTIGATVAEPLIIHKIGSSDTRTQRMLGALEQAELRPAADFIHRYPNELSGGQRQRVAIARAIILEPSLLVTDEPVSMLDVSIRAEVLNLLKKLKTDLNISILYISHDLSTIGYLCDRICIMYLGKIMEVGPTKEVIHHALHPYTQALISAIPRPDPFEKRERIEVKGDLPDQIDLPPGCRFSPRCPRAEEICFQEGPELRSAGPEHRVACHLMKAYGNII